MALSSTVFSFMFGELIAFGIAGPLMTSSGYLTGRGAFSELGARGPSLYHGIKGGVRETRNMIRKLQKKEALVDSSGCVFKDTTPEHE
ncbi:hypothetical protein BGX34_000393 [Mortierella sp. NVP85]|nr:hypothetical protein BGX34_000393 [Mortierella sp. NVP85]